MTYIVAARNGHTTELHDVTRWVVEPAINDPTYTPLLTFYSGADEVSAVFVLRNVVGWGKHSENP